MQTVEAACANLLPHVLCEYLYELSERYTSFYSVHQVWIQYILRFSLNICDISLISLKTWTFLQVIGSAEEASRLLLCEATAIVMRKCFHLLGITPVYKIWMRFHFLFFFSLQNGSEDFMSFTFKSNIWIIILITRRSVIFISVAYDLD